MKNVFSLVLLLNASLVFGQMSDSDYLIKYKKAVQSYASHDFDQAIVTLTPLTGTEYKNSIQPYAMFYFALSAFEADKMFQSREMLRKLFSKYPDWEKIDEAYYLYANSNFSEGYFEEGLSSLNKILSPTVKNSSEGLKSKYLKELKDVNQLKALYEKFPNERLLAVNLVKRIQERPYNSRDDLELSDLLTNRYQLKGELEKSKDPNAITDYSRAFDDNALDFGVLLPFELGEITNSKDVKNPYVYDLYMGMQMAADQMRTDGIPVRVLGIDVSADPETIKEHVEDANFKQMDVIFGPLYAKPNRIAKDYVNKNKIIQVHPISNNSSLVKDEPFVFLNQPSYKTQSDKVLDFTTKQEWEKTCIILHDGGRKNSSLAATYEKEALSRGYEVLLNKAVTPDSEFKEELVAGHVLLIGETGFTTMASRLLGKFKASGPIISTSSGIDMEKISRETLKSDLYLLFPEFVDSSKKEVQDFNNSFKKKMYRPASYYAYLGFDMIRFYTMMLKDGKEIFRLNMNDSENVKGFLTEGFNYERGSNENIVVPIVKWSEGKFEVVN